ncbi:zinc-ribbon domain-containing protein [Pseudenhygromyxa sp. WMMC2535]|uniref:zinc-ribbon domain-containing protein n=1 Tax=Pseudenhygromyxa sp. WMMC2535 TaxID=2712867 RepID=UPI0015563671|nr:zinc-ribbon domain-containing protein [Pseudenhygromyxa sp. WMMC2535]
MIVRCDKCGTEFRFDDRQLGDDGLSVRCSVCRHVFTVERPDANAKPWHVRTTDGMSFAAPDVAALREWIDEGRLHPDDQVSRTGRNWVRIGDMPEFGAAFEVFGVSRVAKTVSPVAAKKAAPAAAVEAKPVEPAAAAEVSAAAVRPAAAPAQKPPVPAAKPAAAPKPKPAAAPKPKPAAAKPAAAPKPVVAKTAAAPKPKPPAMDAAVVTSASDDELDQAPRRGIGPRLIVGLLLFAGVGVVFGVPSIRARVLGSDEAAQPRAEARPEIAAAEQATASLGLGGLAKAEADLLRALDDGGADSNSVAAMKVAMADLLVSRSLAYQIAAALDPARREDYRQRAAEDQEDGERYVDSLEGAPDLDRLEEVRALARLAAGRAEAEVSPLIPEGAEETQLIVQASVLWRDLEAPVPEGLVAGLLGLGERSGLGEGALALALARAGDETEARNVAERMLVTAPDQIVALAVRAGLDASDSTGEDETGESGEAGETGDPDGMGEVDGTEETGEPDPAQAPPPPAGDDGGQGQAGGGGSSLDRLLERGCSQVASGKASEGVKTLLRAFDIKPNDIDVLVCLAQGYAAQGNNGRAAQFYDRALKQSPENRSALAGAAKTAAKTGASVRATSLYERLLKVDPSNAEAKAYLAKHEAPPEPETPAEPEPAKEQDPTPAPEPVPSPTPAEAGAEG